MTARWLTLLPIVLGACDGSSHLNLPPPGWCSAGCVALSTPGQAPQGIAVDADSVFWTESLTGSVLRVSKSGGDASVLVAGSLFGKNDKGGG
ncbi:MAG: hypothetical protein ACREJ3_19145, partial [Polyangiaceae bacterium]